MSTNDTAAILVVDNVGDALQLICSRGFAGMTLLSAVDACRPDLPVIVVTSSDVYHAGALAYANGAAACLAKPVSAAELSTVLRGIAQPKPQLEAA